MRTTVVVALALLAACSSSSAVSSTAVSSTAVSSTAVSSTSSVAPATTTVASTTTSTSTTILAPTTAVLTTAVQPRAPTTDGAAAALLAAWKAANRDQAAQVADAAAADALFARPYLASVQDRGCTDGTQTTNSCIWRYQGETVVQLTLDGSLATGFRITKVEYLS